MAYHEENLSDEVKDFHRVIQSTIEELEAVDWYNQRAAVAKDGDAKALMEHNRDEEIEHAAMGIEWLRRNNPVFDEMLRTFLFTEGPLLEVEENYTSGEGGETRASKGLKIGSLKRSR